MFPPRAAEGDSDAVTSFRVIEGEQERHEINQAFLEFLSRRFAEDIGGDGLVLSGEGPQVLHKIGIGEEAKIKDQVGLAGNPVFEAEGNQIDLDGVQPFFPAGPAALNDAAQIVDGVG